jgi:hypothetical protein
MKSPFPGMDPYLEEHWGDVHTSLMTYARDQLQPHLVPKGLRARLEERVFLEANEMTGRNLYPDIQIIEREQPKKSRKTKSASTALAEPITIRFPPPEPETQRFIEIIDAQSGNRVVTVIEVLSPTNKFPGEGQRLYLQKRDELRAAGVSLVEIDLLRAGTRLYPIPLRRLPKAYRTAYQIYVFKGWIPINLEVYAVPLRERLPTFLIPLRESDEMLPLDLQALIEQTYVNGGYAGDIDYRREPEPGLEGEDVEWADQLLRAAGLR